MRRPWLLLFLPFLVGQSHAPAAGLGAARRCQEQTGTFAGNPYGLARQDPKHRYRLIHDRRIPAVDEAP
jgi:hypothetical protein